MPSGSPNHGSHRSSREKSLMHAEMLVDELNRQPDNLRTVFYLAQTLRELKERAGAGLVSAPGRSRWLG